ncbi:MAG: hypothetical protein IPJ01_07520 [Micavibrio sp.]|mgnify:CR=1 FL=1|nr:hypothetical protein [Micavibrio sp.]
MILKNLESKIRYRIKRNSSSVFIPKDFFDLSDRDQVGRVLRILIDEGILIKIGQGLYARTKISSLTGKPIPEKSLPELAREALKKLGVRIEDSSFDKEYDKGTSTQVPTGRVIAIKGRTSRKIGYGGNYITLERAA